MNLRIVALGTLLIGAIALADDYDDRAKLMGKWELQADSSEKKAVWVMEDIADAKAEVIHLVQAQGDQTVADFKCNVAEECKVQDSGKTVKVTMYFNGARLVELETKGSEIVKRRFTRAAKDDTLEVEVMQLVPAGDTKKQVFKRVSAPPAK